MAKQKFKAIPRLKPGTYTAAQVLKFVEKLITAEPKRLAMMAWMSAYKGKVSDPSAVEHGARVRGEEVVVSPYSYLTPGELARHLPACGTAACAAGWINLSLGKPRSNHHTVDSSPGLRALKNLGLKFKTENKGYGFEGKDGQAADALDNLFSETSLAPHEVVQRLAAIRADYADSLKAKVEVL